jgi:hypothetical protein
MQNSPYKIDEVNLYEILGHDLIVRLSTNFYDRVYSDKEEWFRNIFPQGPRAKEVRILSLHSLFSLTLRLLLLNIPNLFSFSTFSRSLGTFVKDFH